MVSKSYDPHSVYGYDPESGLARVQPAYEPVRPARPKHLQDLFPETVRIDEHRPGLGETRRTCAGCMELIEHGSQVTVTEVVAGFDLTVYAHKGHSEMARTALIGAINEERAKQRLAADVAPGRHRPAD